MQYMTLDWILAQKKKNGVKYVTGTISEIWMSNVY